VPRRPPLRVWVWTAATVALVVVAALLWRGSDAAATESTTAAPAGVPQGTPADAVSEAWQRRSEPVPGDLVADGRVILGSAHGVSAIDPLSGSEAWHYTRSNARMCGATATNGVVVTVFRTEDRCDEAVALDAGTGVRTWTRNVNFRADATLRSTNQIVLAVSPAGLVTLDPTGDNIRWRYDPPAGCVIDDAEVGSAGVALLQICDDGPTAALRLLDGFSGKTHWNRDLPRPQDGDLRLLGADQLLGLVMDDEVQALSPTNGSVRLSLPLSGDDAPRMVSSSGVALVLVDGTLHALDPSSGAELWTADARGLPGAPVAGEDTGGAGMLLLPDEHGFTARDPRSGEELGRSAVADLPPGGTASGAGPVVIYRSADRVLAYR
jgi:outer membrane protein assembly factor BamB